ncbi:MAG: SH3 domain-containing protein [Anaerolineales bacterium]|nr:SH3 domain-containing protein [Anaerolineales bacterium]
MISASKIIGLVMLLASIVVLALSIAAFSRVQKAIAIVESPTFTPTKAPTSVSTATKSPTLTPTPTSTIEPDPPTSTPTVTTTATPTSTDAPIPTSTAPIIPTPDAVVIASNGLNLRSGPGTDYDIVNFLKKGDSLSIQGRTEDSGWIQVRADNRTASGWVSASSQYIQFNTDKNNILIVAPPTPPISTITLAPTATPIPTSTSYSVPIPTAPDNGSGSYGTFPPLTWTWDGTLADDEYFEVRIWHESITDYHPALGWVKVPPFDFNISQERSGKYFWTVTVVKGQNAKLKDWIIQSGWPYQMWDGDLVTELSQESEQRFFFYTPAKGGGGNETNISKPSGSCGEPPCD